MAENALPTEAARQGRILARPLPPHKPPAAPGLHALGLAGADDRDGLLYVAAGYDATRPAPFALLLHGASHDADTVLAPLLPWADAAGLLLLAPDARQFTWDVIMGGYGPDVTFIDGALSYIFARYAVDASRLAIGGFSDGASYALSLGLTNGDLFSHIIAFSPGFMVPVAERGQPCIFVSHGEHDRVLPIDRCSRRIVPQLREAGYDVTYVEFDGPHTVPPDIAVGALEWFCRQP
jgi:phospholipase/carboxylesterase